MLMISTASRRKSGQLRCMGGNNMGAALAYGLRTGLGFQPTSHSEIAFRLVVRREKEALAENDTLRSAKTHSAAVSLFSGGK